jgi:NADPH2:quinone reductase
VATTAELRGRWAEVLAAYASGGLEVRIGARVPLAEAARAHQALESRATTGKVILEI